VVARRQLLEIGYGLGAIKARHRAMMSRPVDEVSAAAHIPLVSLSSGGNDGRLQSAGTSTSV
jgi:hypothetical protein